MNERRPEDLNLDHYRTRKRELDLARRVFGVRAFVADAAARVCDTVAPILAGCRTFPEGDRSGDAEQSALIVPWSTGIDVRTRDVVEVRGVVWCNPPYSRTSEWLRRACEMHEQTGLRVVAFVPLRPDTAAWQRYVHERARVRFLPYRCGFHPPAESGLSSAASSNGRNSLAFVGWGWSPGYDYATPAAASRGAHWAEKRLAAAAGGGVEAAPDPRARKTKRASDGG